MRLSLLGSLVSDDFNNAQNGPGLAAVRLKIETLRLGLLELQKIL